MKPAFQTMSMTTERYTLKHILCCQASFLGTIKAVRTILMYEESAYIADVLSKIEKLSEINN